MRRRLVLEFCGGAALAVPSVELIEPLFVAYDDVGQPVHGFCKLCHAALGFPLHSGNNFYGLDQRFQTFVDIHISILAFASTDV